MKSYCPFPLTLGRVDAEPILSSGAAVVRYAAAGEPIIIDGLACTPEAAPVAVDGLPDDDGEAIIVPAIVAAAMLTLGMRRRGAVVSPGRLQGAPGAQWAPTPTLHTGLLAEG